MDKWYVTLINLNARFMDATSNNLGYIHYINSYRQLTIYGCNTIDTNNRPLLFITYRIYGHNNLTLTVDHLYHLPTPRSHSD